MFPAEFSSPCYGWEFSPFSFFWDSGSFFSWAEDLPHLPESGTALATPVPMGILELLPLAALVILLGRVAWRPRRSRFENLGYYVFPNKAFPEGRRYTPFGGENHFASRYGRKPRWLKYTEQKKGNGRAA